jgi:hypothetical protein
VPVLFFVKRINTETMAEYSKKIGCTIDVGFVVNEALRILINVIHHEQTVLQAGEPCPEAIFLILAYGYRE